MTVHCIHLFDRRGKTLFTKTYSSIAVDQQVSREKTDSGENGSSPVEEQRKLVFGMMYSLGELIGKLTPHDVNPSLSSIETGTTTVHNYETLSGLRFALYTSTDVCNSKTSSISGSGGGNKSSMNQQPYAQDVLKHIYSNIWVDCVVRSPMYKPGLILAVGEKELITEDGEEKFDIGLTNFEVKLDAYLNSLPWFR